MVEFVNSKTPLQNHEKYSKPIIHQFIPVKEQKHADKKRTNQVGPHHT